MTRRKKLNKIDVCKAMITMLVLVIMVTACGGQAPEASKARSRALINAGGIVPAEEIRVAEYLQYYEQDFPEPLQDALGLDLRLGNNRIPAEGGLVWLQMGLQTKSSETEMMAPLNLSLVIDRSSSMNSADKMPYLKKALQIFLESLQPDDLISIVTYSDQASVLLAAQPVGDKSWVQRIVNRIRPEGGTNLHAGMMTGFRQVDQNFDIRRNNRVILLTDGQANQGIVDSEQIAANALAYNQRGIHLSTIGLGLDFNDALLSQLAQQGEGGYSFVDSAEEMDRVFRAHVSGLTQRVAADISLTLIPASGVTLVGLTGLETTPPAAGVNIPLPPLGTGDSRVTLAQLQFDPAHRADRSRPLATVQLNYFDELARRPVVISQEISAETAFNLNGYDPTWNLEVLRNVTIQQTAEGMREIDHLFDVHQYEAAWRLAVALENNLAEVAQLTQDNQLRKDVMLMQQYQDTLAQAVWQIENRAPRLAEVRLLSEQQSAQSNAGYIPSVPQVEIR